MQHSVTIWAYRLNVLDWVDNVGMSDLRQWNKVVYMDETLPKGPVDTLKIKTTDLTCWTVVLNGSRPHFRVPFVLIHSNPLHRSFPVLLMLRDFIRKRTRITLGNDCELVLFEDPKASGAKAPLKS